MSNFKNIKPMITSTNLSMLRCLEHFQVMTNVLAYLKAENLEELKLESIAATFEAKLKLYDEVLVLERGNALSGKLNQADLDRDLALRSLISIIKVYLSFPEEEKADAASKLFHLIGKYGKEIDKMPYLQETGVLKNLFQDLDKDDSKAAIALLHIDDWVEKLKTSAQAFEQMFVSRETDNSTKLSAKVKSARQDTQTVFEQLVTLINAYEIVYGAEAYASLSAKIIEAVNYARTQAARRGPRTKSDETTVKE